MRLRTIFTSRWAALFWAGGIVWSAVDVATSAPSAPPGNAADAAASATDGNPLGAADVNALASLLNGN